MRGSELSFPIAIMVKHLVLPYEMLLPVGTVALGCELYSACVEPGKGVPCPNQTWGSIPRLSPCFTMFISCLVLPVPISLTHQLIPQLQQPAFGASLLHGNC